MSTKKLYTNFDLHGLNLQHRVVLAPLTRSRAPGRVPTPLMATYYSQRASPGGVLISEATAISQQGTGYFNTPGIWSDEQVEAWKPITKAVHDKGGYIVCQLWHVGRLSLPCFQPNRKAPVSSSAIAPLGDGYTDEGKPETYGTPHALTIEEIKDILKDYVVACENAKKAGFDGVEIHGANGYLLQQFLEDGSNTRTDEYGGSIENRARFLFEVVDTCVKAFGPNRVGIRLAPGFDMYGGKDSNPWELYSYVINKLNDHSLSYIHLIEPRYDGNENAGEEILKLASKNFRPLYKGPFMAAGGYKKESGEEAVENGHADMVVYGRIFIANPDLPYRLQHNIPLNPYNRKTFYGGNEVGYTDYPFSQQD